MAFVRIPRRRRGHFNPIQGRHYLGPDDLTGAVNRLAVAIGAEVARVARTVDGARFEAMRTRATEFAPNAQGVLKDPARFFRSGTSGEGRAALGDAAYAAFETRCRGLAPLPVVDWLLR